MGLLETLQKVAVDIVGKTGAVLDRDENVIRPTPEMSDEILLAFIAKAQKQLDIYNEEARRRGLVYDG